MTVVARKLHDFERQRPGSFRTWLRGITVNCLRDFLKSKQYRSRATGGTEMLDMASAREDANGEFTKLGISNMRPTWYQSCWKREARILSQVH